MQKSKLQTKHERNQTEELRIRLPQAIVDFLRWQAMGSKISLEDQFRRSLAFAIKSDVDEQDRLPYLYADSESLKLSLDQELRESQ